MALAAGLGMACAWPALAQQAGSPFAGFTERRDQPLQFRADRAEVFDSEQRAVLTGNVFIRQGESTLETHQLIILYEQRRGTGEAAPRPPQPPLGDGSSQTVREMRMEGGVTVTSRNQRATADRGAFFSAQNFVVLQGGVVLQQCTNVTRGDRLEANITTNQVQMMGGTSSQGRVAGQFQPGVALPDDCPLRPGRYHAQVPGGAPPPAATAAPAPSRGN